MWHFSFSRFLPLLLLLKGIRADSLIPATEGEYACSPGDTVLRLVTTIEIVLFELSINTYIRQNTTINISGGITIIVTNAPTSIVTVITGTTTTDTTATATIITKTVTSSDSVPTAFFLVPGAVAAARNKRQDAGTFIGAAGEVVDSCFDAIAFTIENGQLRSEAGILSTLPGLLAKPFVLSRTEETISTTFGLTDQLLWTNDVFENGQATFCLAGGSVFVIFLANVTIPSCEPRDLLPIPASFCQDGGESSILPTEFSFSPTTTYLEASSSTPITETSGVPSIPGSSTSQDTLTSLSNIETVSEMSTASTTSDPESLVISTYFTSEMQSPSVSVTLITTSNIEPFSTLSPVTTEPIVQHSTSISEAGSEIGSSTVLSGGPISSIGTIISANPSTSILSSDASTTFTSYLISTFSTRESSNIDIPDFTTTALDFPTATTFTSTIPAPSAEPSPVLCTGTGQIIDEVDNVIVCICDTGFFSETEPGTGDLLCTPYTSCTLSGEVLDPATNSCVCDVGYTASTDDDTGALICSIECPLSGQLPDPGTNTCVCDTGYLSAPDPVSGALICNIVCQGQGLLVDSSTNTCYCDVNYASETDPVSGVVIACSSTIVCLGINTNLDTVFNTCQCNPGFTGVPDPVL
ncbi:hypothetical protein IFR04_005272, partial [Cadophora malorum]